MKVLRASGVLVVVLAVAAAGFWAGRTAFRPPDDPLTVAPEPIVHVVGEGTVGRSLRFTAVAEWDLTRVGEAAGGGVVTSVSVAPGDLIAAGDVLIDVDLHPVVVAQGEVPMFRRLAPGSSGEDVAQLQQLLAALGLFDGETDGAFRASTRVAVGLWQDSLGVSNTGVVEPGHIIFVPTLPVRAVLAETLRVGSRLVDGETIVLAVPDEPDFWIPLAPEQSQVVPLSAAVLVTYPSGVWEAQTVVAQSRPDLAQLHLVLASKDGGPVCHPDCAEWIPVGSRVNFGAEVVVVPETTGPVVPAAAIRIDAASRPQVMMEDGSMVEVTIVESGSGLVVVDGIQVGTRILLPVSAR